jgi:hypothetical protein
MIIFGFLPKSPEMMAVAVAFSMAWREAEVESGTGEDQARGLLAAFRGELYQCFTGRADALFELVDAVLCAGEPVRVLAGLSLVPEHRRGHGGLYDAVHAGRIDIARLRRSLACLPLPRWSDGRIRLAVDVSNWLRPGAATSPERHPRRPRFRLRPDEAGLAAAPAHPAHHGQPRPGDQSHRARPALLTAAALAVCVLAAACWVLASDARTGRGGGGAGGLARRARPGGRGYGPGSGPGALVAVAVGLVTLARRLPQQAVEPEASVSLPPLTAWNGSWNVWPRNSSAISASGVVRRAVCAGSDCAA